jgi:hypothetical protein
MSRVVVESLSLSSRLKETHVIARHYKALAATILATLIAVVAAGTVQAAPAFDISLKSDLSEVQSVEIRADGGQFRLAYGDGGPGVSETSDLPYDASATAVQSALNSLANISNGGGAVTVASVLSSNGERLYRIAFDSGPFAETDVPLLRYLKGTSPLTGARPDKVDIYTMDIPGLHRNDLRIDYELTVANTAAPVTRRPVVGDTLGCVGAKPALNWTPSVVATRPSGFTFEWWRNGVKIPGATSANYAVTADDAGAQLQCLVYAANSNQTATSVLASLELAPAASVVDPQPSVAPPAPAAINVAGARPAVTGSGTAAGSSTRTCAAPANWAAPDASTVTYSFQWLRNGQPIAGETAANHTITTADLGTVLQCLVTGSTGSGTAPGGGKLVGTSTPAAINLAPNTVTNMPTVSATANPMVVIDAASPVIEMDLPAGEQSFLRLELLNNPADVSADNPVNNYWSCGTQPAAGLEPAKLTCTNPNVMRPQGPWRAFGIAMAPGSDLADGAEVAVTVSGVGVPTLMEAHTLAFLPAVPFGITPETFETDVLDTAGDDYTQAGGHPNSVRTTVGFNHHRRLNDGNTLPEDPYQQAFNQRNGPVELVKQLKTDAPPGFVGNPLAPVVQCEDPQLLLTGDCPLESVVGEAFFRAWTFGTAETGEVNSPRALVAIKPERGVPAQFAFADTLTKGVYVLDARLRPEDGYAVSIDVGPIVQNPEFMALGATICGYGATSSTAGGELQMTGCKEPGDPGAYESPLFTMPTTCSSEPLQTKISLDSWSTPGVFHSAIVDEPLLTGCDQVPFTPAVSMSPTSSVADSASGFDASIDVPSDGLLDHHGISQSHLKKTVVRLPKGVSVNPSAATGLEGCSDMQLGLGTNDEPSCPDGSKIGTATATTPVLEETLTGVMVLRTPESTDPQSGDMLRVALIVRNDERGILVKIPGSAVADPQTGRLTATFDDSPQLPIGHVDVHLRGGEKGVLAIGQDCDSDLFTRATLTPWSGNADAVSGTPRDVDQRCGNGFAPNLAAGNSDNRARGQGGTYSFKFSRQDGEQWLRGLTAKLPKGLLASVKDVPLCANALADAGNCPSSSKIGIVDAKAGSGDPFVLEEKGEVFLTEGYKGGEYGLAVKIRPVAGPFRGEFELSPIVVRQAIHVDRTTAEVSAISDPFPLIHHGVPLRVREVHVLVNRGGFMVNPSDCEQKQSSATLLSDEGTTAAFSDPFQVSGCANLGFRPKLALRLTGRKQVTTGKHPGIKAVVTQQGTSEAGIERAVVRLPKSLALDPNNAQALCEFEDGTKPDLENRCPKGSIVGRARAKTPLLKNDLVGNVYFVKNVRRDPETGNEIRTLPMIVVALRGEIAINLKGESSTTRGGKLVNTFASVPDAPISRFNLNIKGGKTGIVAVTRTRKAKINLCAGRHVAEADMDGHNGRRNDSNVRMKTPCTKRQTKNAKRAAKRATKARKARV